MPPSVGQRRRTGRRRGGVAAGCAAALIAIAGSAAPIRFAALAATPPAPAASAFVAVGPVRLADTRAPVCGCSAVGTSTITVPIDGRPGVPDGAVAAVVVITATATASPGFVTAWPTGRARPTASTLNTRPDRVVANTAIVPIGTDGSISLYRKVPGDLIVDITGAFVAAADARAGRFVPVASRRLIDTRSGAPIAPGHDLVVAVPAGVPADATALTVTVTSVGDESPGFVSSRPVGTPVNDTSFLNVNGSGQPVAATAILPVSPRGLALRTRHRGHLVVDLLGYFTGPSAPASTAGLFVPMDPARLLDTRTDPPRAWPGGTVELAVSFSDAGSIVTNVTATAADRAGFLTAFPARTSRPGTSNVNTVAFEHTVANLAVTRLSTVGVAYYAKTGADVVVDVTGRFLGEPVPTTTAAAPNRVPRSRVLMVGDSTLASLNLYTDARRAFVGFDAVVDADNCRRLVRPSCLSPVTGRVPNTILEAVQGASGSFDMVVVRAGYNDWNSDFPGEFDAVVRAARAKGAHTILWMSYTAAWSPSPRALQAYRENNVDLFRLVSLPQYADVVLADLDAYTRTAPSSWTWDGAHLTEYGTWLVADYIARWVAAIEHRPCPEQWGPGGMAYTPCPPPERIGAVPNVIALY